MDSEKQRTTESPRQSRKPIAPWTVVGAIAGVGLMAFVLGRATSPELPSGTVVHEPATAEHGAKDDHAHEGDEHGEAEIKFDGDAAQTGNVRVATVALTTQAASIPFTGQIAPSPNRVVRVSSIVPGRVTHLYVAVGDNVKRGQTLALIESRAIGEAQSAYQQANVRLQNARTNYNVVQQQARAGVFSRAPLETAKRAQIAAIAEVRMQETAVRQASVTLDNARRLARTGAYASPTLEAARAQSAQATAALRTAEAALTNAQAGVRSAQSELERRRQQASSGSYAARPVEEARRVLTTARAARGAAQSEVATTRSNLSRAKSLSAEGLIARRDLESSQQAFDAATARLETTQSDEITAQQELERQQRLASTNVTEKAEVAAAQRELEAAQADVRTRNAEIVRARESLRMAGVVLSRERVIFGQNIANRREVSLARSALESSRNELAKARQNLLVANAAYERERRIARQNLNDIAQVQTARSAYLEARGDVAAAQTALALLKSAPGGRASLPIVAPIAGVVQEREVAPGEVLDTDRQLMTIADLSTVHVDMFLPERDIAKVRLDAPVEVHVEALPGRAFRGRIELIHTELDPKTRTVEAHAELRNTGALRIGMAARGQIFIAGGTSAITVPAGAVQDMEGRKVVFVASDKPNTFIARNVETGAAVGGRTVIKSGLKPGDKAVVQGAFIVKAQAMKAELGHEH